MKKFPISLIAAALLLVSCTGRVAPADVTLRFAYSDGTCLTKEVPLGRKSDRLVLHVDRKDLTGLDTLTVIPSFSASIPACDGYFVFPGGNAALFNAERPDQRIVASTYKRVYRGGSNQMPISVLKTPESCYLEHWKTYRFDAIPFLIYQNGTYRHEIKLLMFNVGEPYEDFEVDFYPLSGDDASYSGAGRLYRKIQLAAGNIVPLREKVKGRPELEYVVRYPEIRIRQGWKPVPCSVEHQTLENEPEMRVKVTFDKVGEIIDSLKAAGVEGAQLTLVGWNISGHDGRFPTVFPADPRLGGMEGLKRLIAKAQREGFQIVPHVCTGDAYEISPEWDPDDLTLFPDSTNISPAVYGGGRMFKLCYRASYEKFIRPLSDSLAALGFRGLAYNDVYSIIPPPVCTNPHHPMNSAEAQEYAWKTLEYMGDKMGGIASEGGYDFLSPLLDFALYPTMLRFDQMHPERLLDTFFPIWHIVYDGSIPSCPMSQAINFNIKGPEGMKLVEYGGHPTYYFYSAHRDDARNWMGTTTLDLKVDTQEDLVAAVKAIRYGYDYLRQYGDLQYEFMEDHSEIAPGVFRSVYSDGTETICNYNSDPFVYKDREVAGESFEFYRK